MYSVHKFVDVITLSEVIEKHDKSNMCSHLNNVVEWSDYNLMNINIARTEEMLIGRIKKKSTPNIFICSNVIERVFFHSRQLVYKLKTT